MTADSPRPAPATRWAFLETTWGAAAPGLIVLFVLWVIAFLRIDFAAFTQKQIDELWQSLGSAALTEDPIGSIGAMHIQPPGMNVLYAIDLALTPSRHLVLAAILLVTALGTVFLLVDTLRRFGVPGNWAAGAGLLYALLPSTVIYALWAYVTSPLSFMTMAAVWGISYMSRSALIGSTCSAVAMLALVLTRPSFTWIVLVVWCALLIVLLLRRRRVQRVGLAVGLVTAAVVVGLAVQAHYFVSFGLPFMSSWSGENLGKALAVSKSLVVTPEAEASLREDPCLSQMLDAYRADALNRWDDAAFRGLPACSTVTGLELRGEPAWDSPMKGGSANPNFNYADRLVASAYWSRMMTVIVEHAPQQLVRMALTTDYGPHGSGVGLYLSPPEDYPFVKPIRDSLPTAVPGGFLSLLLAPVLFALVFVGILRAAFVRRSRLRSSAPFWFSAGLVLFHMATNTLAEYSENMRYQAEIDAVLLAAGMMVLFDLLRPVGEESPREATAPQEVA